MRTVSRLVDEIRSYFGDDPDLMRIVVNAVSWVEASLAIGLLGEKVPERSLVTGANIREALKELPRCPITMAVDFETLARIAGLDRVGSGWEREYQDPAGDYTLVLLGEGNYCYDIVVRSEGRTLMWMPHDSAEDYLNPDIVDLVMERTTLLKNVIELVGEMGMPFSPIFYLSLDDWRAEYAETVFGEICDVFGVSGAKLADPGEVFREERIRLRQQDLEGGSSGLSWSG